MITQYPLRTLCLALATTLTMSACGDKQNDATNAQTQTTQETKNTANTTQTLTINNASEPETLDPQLANGVQEANIIRQFSEGLVSTDNDGNIIAGMASEWTTEDNKVWIFKLRDASWSNGDPVTAHDFVYTFRRLADPKTGSYYASYLDDAKVANAQAVIDGKLSTDKLGIEAVDDKTLKITLSEPIPYFPDMLIHSSVQPVHPATVDEHQEKWTDPKNIVVNGPYKPTQWHVNEKIVLERNPYYYNNDNTKLDTLVILPISSATTDVMRYQAGEVDITASELPPEQFEALKKELGDELKTAPTLCTYYYDLNHSKAPFNDAKVRQALSLTLDREAIAEKVMGQGQIVAYQFTPSAIKGGVSYTPTWKAWDKAKRTEAAKKLLTEAGYSQSNPLKFDLLYDTNESHKKIAVAATSLWKEALGFVDINLVNQEWKTYLDSRRNGDFQMVRARWCGDYNEASTFLNLMKSNNTNNWSRFSNSAYDETLASTLSATISDGERVKLYEKAEQILDEQHAHIDIFYYANVRLVKPYVQGYSNKDPLDQWHAKYWSITQK